jgi:hypothetical protein
MDLGFETIGNATLICHDKRPVIVTDPWIVEHAYFGSWGLSHVIPVETMESIKSSQYVWISHGHPDHLSSRSLDLLRDKKFLIPDHVGGRILEGLRWRGFDVTVLNDRRWYPISDRIRILCIADYNQDAILLVDIGGSLIVNFNDASDHGWGSFVKQTIRKYKVSFHLQLSGFGDADMINVWRDDGTFIEPRAGRKKPVGKLIARQTERWRTKYFIPFSSMHIYQRADSVWARKYGTKLSDYAVGFESNSSELLPAFVRYDVAKQTYSQIDPLARSPEPLDPKECGDDWSEPLECADKKKITAYFKAISHLEEFLDFVSVRVDGAEHVVELASRRFDRGLTFEVPRHSLMVAIENEIFDDLLIGNFMKTIIHGNFPRLLLYPEFTPYVAKYADNGLAKSKTQMRAYFKEYMMRAPLDYLRYSIETRAVNAVRFSLNEDSPLYRLGMRTYFWMKGSGFSS